MSKRSRVLVAKRQGPKSPRVSLPDRTVEEVSRVQSLQRALAEGQPDVALIALDLPGLGGAEGLREMSKLSPKTKVVALTRHADDDEELDVLRTGARGYVQTDDGQPIPKVVDKVEEGEVWAARRTIGRLLDEIFSDQPSDVKPDEAESLLIEKLRQLTPRERDILRLLSSGASNKEIAASLQVTVSTVKAHLTKIFRKLGQPDRLHLALAATRGK